MIKLTRLNNDAFYVNCELIEFAEQTPDTVISMASGRKILVAESCEEVRRLVLEYKSSIPGFMRNECE
ncbi:MAG: flagellar FlbD family protein [Christensenellales bacterium]|jgi:flagellar protein FlbD